MRNVYRIALLFFLTEVAMAFAAWQQQPAASDPQPPYSVNPGASQDSRLFFFPASPRRSQPPPGSRSGRFQRPEPAYCWRWQPERRQWIPAHWQVIPGCWVYNGPPFSPEGY